MLIEDAGSLGDVEGCLVEFDVKRTPASSPKFERPRPRDTAEQ